LKTFEIYSFVTVKMEHCANVGNDIFVKSWVRQITTLYNIL